MAPRHTFNLWTSYRLAQRVGHQHRGPGTKQGVHRPRQRFTIDGYGLLNLGVRYRRGPVEYALNVNNVTDTEYFASVLYDTQMYPGEPINVLGRCASVCDSTGVS